MGEIADLRTATAHRAWERRWRQETGRSDWLAVEPDVEAVVPALHLRKVQRVLDLGCGAGRHALYLAAKGFETFALDASPSGLDHLRGSALQQDLAVEAQLGRMTHLPYATGSFGFVLAFNVVYHGDPDVVAQTLSEIRRVLRPGGLLQGTMLSKRNVRYGKGREVAPDTFVVETDDDPEKRHPHFYCCAAELIDLIEGFEVLALSDLVHTTPGSWHWHILAERLDD